MDAVMPACDFEYTATDEGAVSNERTYAAVMHAGVYAYALSFPLAFLIPMIMWLVKRNDSPFLDDHGKEALNFHISLVIYILISIPLLFFGVGFILLMLVIPLWWLITPIFAIVAATRGEFYRYPMCLRLIS
jgi:uncharacterized Tic20 family protein